MSKRYTHRTLIGAVLIAPVILIVLAYAQAKERPADDPDPADKAASEAEDPEKIAARYTVPEGGVDQLVEFITGLQKYKPKSFADHLRHREKASEAILAAARKIVELKPAKDSDALAQANTILLKHRVATVADASDGERATLIQEIRQRIDSKKPDELTQLDLGFAFALSEAIENGGHYKEAVELYREFGKSFVASANRRVAGAGQQLQASARRVGMLGNKLKLKGTTHDGKAFDWKSYRGKVVLVDFWATWCQPCLQEIPNVRRNYEKYHEKGFEVVGISLDEDGDTLGQFLKREKLPWVTLFEDGEGGNSIADKCGITAIPALLLVDQKGKVVSIDAHGPELSRLLAELLGPTDEPSGKQDT